RLTEWRRGQRIVLEANTGYREEYFPAPPKDADAATRAIAKSMAGKRLPQIGRVELSVIEAPQPLLLAFDSGALDVLELPFELAAKAVDSSGHLLPRYADQGVTLQRVVDLYLGYLFFNMADPDREGLCELPEGRPLTLHIGTTPEDRERDDLIRKNLRAVGIRVEFVNRKWADLLKMARAGQLQAWMLGLFPVSADAVMLTLY